ncbi:MAG: type II toxin-antitoxin system VapC family toxin [Burkholderiaceae bacterium]|jgi:predicted nucleic-acid-binding protein|nr:type II toxin-antitoxin system VapC family toxin [Burkholderiaceae bacterium]
MKAVLDTNVLVRILTNDDVKQAQAAKNLLLQADEIIIPTPVLCELVWVLSGTYKFKAGRIHQHITRIMNSRQAVVNDGEVLAGLAFMEKGGDFADGVNIHCGQSMAQGDTPVLSRLTARRYACLPRRACPRWRRSSRLGSLRAGGLHGAGELALHVQPQPGQARAGWPSKVFH